LGLAVFGSDCPGLILISPHAFAVAHCGWRGIAAGIVANATHAMTELGAHREQIVAFIGPGICHNCYEVDAEVLNAANWPKDSLTTSSKVDRWQLDLARTIAVQLGELGIQQVLHSRVCTSCDLNLHSHRHQGPGVVQVLAVHQE
jgi:copper oxidase (laccase) domain-containing protein